MPRKSFPTAVVRAELFDTRRWRSGPSPLDTWCTALSTSRRRMAPARQPEPPPLRAAVVPVPLTAALRYRPLDYCRCG